MAPFPPFCCSMDPKAQLIAGLVPALQFARCGMRHGLAAHGLAAHAEGSAPTHRQTAPSGFCLDSSLLIPSRLRQAPRDREGMVQRRERHPCSQQGRRRRGASGVRSSASQGASSGLITCSHCHHWVVITRTNSTHTNSTHIYTHTYTHTLTHTEHTHTLTHTEHTHTRNTHTVTHGHTHTYTHTHTHGHTRSHKATRRTNCCCNDYRDVPHSGPLYYVIVLYLMATTCWRTTPVGILAIALMCGGDGMADIVGECVP